MVAYVHYELNMAVVKHHPIEVSRGDMDLCGGRVMWGVTRFV